MSARLTSVAGATLALALFGMAGMAHASSLTSAQIQSIVNLLQVFGADQATVNNVQAVLEGQTPAQASSTVIGTDTGTLSGVVQNASSTSCATISSTLRAGSTDQETDGEVSKLQIFLSKDKGVYPEGLVTGFFGHATEDAVQRWQAMHGVVATGTPETNGFGVVGPQTRGELDREMETECEQGDSHHGDNGGEHSGVPSTGPQPHGSEDN